MASGNDSADDFFNSFDANSPPPKPSKSLKPPTSGNNAPPPKPKPRPPPPPPPGARQGRAAGARAATSTTATATTRAGQTTASTSYYGSAAAAATTASAAAAPGAAAAGTSNSYYGQQQQRQQATSLVNRGTAAGQTSQQRQSYHLGATTTTAAAAPQPAMFNPAAAAPSSAGHTSSYASQQPTQQQPANFYAAAPVSSETPDTSGDWFTPDAPSSTAATDATTATSSAAPTASNPYAQSAMFHSSSSLEGRMDSGAAMAPAPAPNFAVFTSSSAPSSGDAPRGYNPAEFENEPPLLEELGINLQHILLKTKAVVIPFKRFSGRDSALLDPALIVEDPDLAGPAAFGLLLGGELLLSGKIHFGYIYGFGVFGCLALTLILNLMTPQKAVSIWTVASILGYSLLPVNVLAAIKLVLVDLVRLETLGQLLALLTILWSTTASTRLLEVGCGMRAQRYLLAYPIALLYSAFVLITIF